MSLADKLATGPTKPTKTLLVDRYLAAMEPPLADAFRGALTDRHRWSDRELARELTGDGYEISPGAILNWRQKNGVNG